MQLKKTAIALALAAAAIPALAEEDFPRLDHAFVIVMENHHISQILGAEAPTPFIKSYAASANLAANYFGVGHPSLTNYLEIVGGSNFDVVNDNNPDWHNKACKSGLSTSTPQLEGSPNICPIAGAGLDAETPALDTTNEGSTATPIHNDYVAPAWTVGKTIADQLVEAGKTWKSYQENMPAAGADNVAFSDGLLTDTSAVPRLLDANGKPVLVPDANGVPTTVAATKVPHLYASKHNPFVYFANVQEGKNPANSLKNIVGFDALFADLASGKVPTYSFIAPNQCHDQHGRGSSEVGPGCSSDSGTLAQGDMTVKALVGAIKSSPVWAKGHNAIVVVWDENDYSSLPNQVVTIVDTNYGVTGVSSKEHYTHFSLLKSLEAGFGLDYLNHAADRDVKLMSDLFAEH